MSEHEDRRPYWQRFTKGDGSWIRYASHQSGPPGEDLAALRRGAGREPGTVPEMWRFHVAPVPEDRFLAFTDVWEPPVTYAAEHHALVLYGHHQQSKDRPMHRQSSGDDSERERFGLGDAVRVLHASKRYSQEAVDRRFYAAVTADTLEELAVHLRGVIGQLRTLPTPQSLDYTQLADDLGAWLFPEARHRVRRRWGLQYHAYRPADNGDDKASTEAVQST